MSDRSGSFGGANRRLSGPTGGTSILDLDAALRIVRADPAGADLLRRGGAPDSPDLERLLSACPGGPRTLDRIRALVRKGSPDPGPVGDLTLDGQALQARLSRHDGPESPASCWRLTLVPTAQGPGSLDQMLGLAVSGLPFGETARQLLVRLLAALPADAAALRLRDRREPIVAGAAVASGWSHDLAGAVEEGGFLVADLETDARVPAGRELAAEGWRTYLCHPLHASGQVLGTLHVLARGPARFDESSVSRVASVCHLLALLAFGQRSSREPLSEGSGEIGLLLELTRSLGHLTAADEIPDLVLEAFPRVADPDVAVVILGDGGAGWDCRLQEYESVPEDLGRAARAAARAALDRATGREGSLETPAPGGSWGAQLHEPVLRRGVAVGMLSLFTVRSGCLREAQHRLLLTIAAQVSLTLDRLETVRERERSRLESVVDAMGEGLLWVDASGRLQLANPAARGFLEELLGDPEPRRLSRLGEVELARVARQLADGPGKRYHAELGGGTRRFSLTASAVEGGGAEEAGGMVLLLSDVTEQHAMQQKLLQSEKLSALGEMISGVAHELNNPLTAVMGYAQLLDSRTSIDPQVKEKVHTIHREALRCQRIVQNLLSFARNRHPERAPVDLNGVIRSVLQLLEYPLRIDGIALDVRLSPDLPAVRGDGHLLQQVVLNLTNNAHHAMQEAGRPGRLRIQSSYGSGRVRLVVEDNGIGIPPDRCGKIFDPFFSTKVVGKGTGLGLSLAYGCIQEHGGEIKVDSQAGEWTRFTIELPASPGLEAPAPPQEDRPSVRDWTGAPADILVVDDEPAVAEIISEVLQSGGHRVTVVHDGLAAWAHLENGAVDLVLSDLKMPRMGGRELYEEIRRRRPELAGKIIFTTGDTVGRATREFLRRTGRPYLTKPFQIADLQDVVDRTLAS